MRSVCCCRPISRACSAPRSRRSACARPCWHTGSSACSARAAAARPAWPSRWRTRCGRMPTGRRRWRRRTSRSTSSPSCRSPPAAKAGRRSTPSSPRCRSTPTAAMHARRSSRPWPAAACCCCSTTSNNSSTASPSRSPSCCRRCRVCTCWPPRVARWSWPARWVSTCSRSPCRPRQTPATARWPPIRPSPCSSSAPARCAPTFT